MIIMKKTHQKSSKSNSKLPKYSAPKPNCDGCKKQSFQKTQTQIKNQKRQSHNKLFTIIQSFHNNLCSLPLNILLANQNQDEWIKEQYQTLGSLSAKLESVKDTPQVQYYRAKIQTVKLVLKNIQTNLETLQTLNYESIKSQRRNINQYNSYGGSSASSSISGSRLKVSNKRNWDDLLADSDKTSQNPQQYQQDRKQNNQILQNLQTQKTRQFNTKIFDKSKFFKTQKVHDQQLYTATSKQIQTIPSRVYEQSLYEIKSSQNNDSYDKLCEINKEKYRQQINSMKNSNKLVTHDLVCLKTHKSQINEQQQEIYEENTSPPTKTKRIPKKQSLQIAYETNTKNMPKKASIQNNSTKLFPFALAQNQLEQNIQRLNQKIQQLQIELNESQTEINDKNQQIQSLLINNEQLQAVIEVYKTERISSQQSCKYSLQRITILQQNNQKMQSQLNQWKNRQKDLRKTITQHQKHIEQLKYINEKLNNQIVAEVQQMHNMRQQAQLLIAQVQQAKKRQNIIQQQLLIYKNRNKQLVSEQQLHKLVSRETYAGKNQKVKQLREIIQQHRLNLEDSQSIRRRTINDSHQLQQNWESSRNGRSISNYVNI